MAEQGEGIQNCHGLIYGLVPVTYRVYIRLVGGAAATGRSKTQWGATESEIADQLTHPPEGRKRVELIDNRATVQEPTP